MTINLRLKRLLFTINQALMTDLNKFKNEKASGYDIWSINYFYISKEKSKFQSKITFFLGKTPPFCENLTYANSQDKKLVFF